MDDLGERLNEILSDPQLMERISGLAGSLFGGEGRPEPQKEKHAAPPDDLGFDPALLARVAGIMRSQGEKREERALLDAMRPYLSPRRREKMDRAVRLARVFGHGVTFAGYFHTLFAIGFKSILAIGWMAFATF